MNKFDAMRDEAMDTQSPYTAFAKTTSCHTNAEFNTTPKIPQQSVSCLNGIKKSSSYQIGEVQRSNSPLNFNEASTLMTQNTQEMFIEATSTNKSSDVTAEALLPLDLIREVVKDQIEDLRDEMMSENFKFKAEMIKEFMSLKVFLIKYSKNNLYQFMKDFIIFCRVI
jgi:hypothetical protein